MKHLKTFESFTTDIELVDEGLKDIMNKAKDLISLKPELNKTHQKLITQSVKEVDTNKFKFMQVMGKDKTKKEFSIDGYLKMAEDVDNFNGRFKTQGDVVYYVPAEFKGSDGGFKTKGGFGG